MYDQPTAPKPSPLTPAYRNSIPTPSPHHQPLPTPQAHSPPPTQSLFHGCGHPLNPSTLPSTSTSSSHPYMSIYRASSSPKPKQPSPFRSNVSVPALMTWGAGSPSLCSHFGACALLRAKNHTLRSWRQETAYIATLRATGRVCRKNLSHKRPVSVIETHPKAHPKTYRMRGQSRKRKTSGGPYA